MGYVSSPYRVLYEAKGFRSGLTNVQAVIMKPDQSIAGPFTMTEMPSVFAGRYFFDFITSSSDPEGEYFAAIFSPTENFQTTFRLSLYQKTATQASLNASVTSISDELEEIGDQVNFISANVI